MLIHLLTPNGLPWTRNGVPRTDEAHDRLIAEKKSSTPELLCKGLPFEFEDFLRYCRQLKFKAKPDYAKWKDAFKALLVEEGYPSDTSFVWPPPVSVAVCIFTACFVYNIDIVFSSTFSLSFLLLFFPVA